MTTTADDQIHLADAPDIPGLRFRHHRGPEDYPGMVAANQASREHGGSLELLTVETMTRDYAHLVNCDPFDDILIVELDDTIIGYARTEWRQLTAGGRQFSPVGLLVPEQRGRGIGGAMLLGGTPARAGRGDAARGSAVADARVDWDTDTHAKALYEERGWIITGRGYEMIRPTLDDIPSVPLPDGFDIRPIDPSDRRAVWDAAQDAFRDHRAEEEWTEEDWLRDDADPHQDPSLWAIAFAADEMAAGVEGADDRRGERPPRRPARVHRWCLDAEAVPTTRSRTGLAGARPRPPARPRDDERLPRRRRHQPEPGDGSL